MSHSVFAIRHMEIWQFVSCSPATSVVRNVADLQTNAPIPLRLHFASGHQLHRSDRHEILRCSAHNDTSSSESSLLQQQAFVSAVHTSPINAIA
jgi:hypothetical protein